MFGICLFQSSRNLEHPRALLVQPPFYHTLCTNQCYPNHGENQKQSEIKGLKRNVCLKSALYIRPLRLLSLHRLSLWVVTLFGRPVQSMPVVHSMAHLLSNQARSTRQQVYSRRAGNQLSVLSFPVNYVELVENDKRWPSYLVERSYSPHYSCTNKLGVHFFKERLSGEKLSRSRYCYCLSAVVYLVFGFAIFTANFQYRRLFFYPQLRDARSGIQPYPHNVFFSCVPKGFEKRIRVCYDVRVPQNLLAVRTEKENCSISLWSIVGTNEG